MRHAGNARLGMSTTVEARYLEQLPTSLRAAGLGRTTRAPHGGFTLARPPSGIGLIDIIQVMERSTAPVECTDDAGTRSRSESCVARGVWEEARGDTDQVLKSTTLQGLLERQEIAGQKAKAHIGNGISR